MTKVSTCVDCATPIAGDSLRCGACDDRLDVMLLPPAQAGTILVHWIVAVELIVIGTLGLILAARGCTS